MDKLLLTGFHPEQLSHSLTALFIHAKQFVNDALWDEKVQSSIRNIIVKLSLRSTDYRLSSPPLSRSAYDGRAARRVFRVLRRR